MLLAASMEVYYPQRQNINIVNKEVTPTLFQFLRKVKDGNYMVCITRLRGHGQKCDWEVDSTDSP